MRVEPDRYTWVHDRGRQAWHVVPGGWPHRQHRPAVALCGLTRQPADDWSPDPAIAVAPAEVCSGCWRQWQARIGRAVLAVPILALLDRVLMAAEQLISQVHTDRHFQPADLERPTIEALLALEDAVSAAQRAGARAVRH